jgi:hypothetical protein
MKMTDEEKRLIKTTRKLESRSLREMLMFQAETMVQAQDALKVDYGLDTKEPPKPAA